MKEMQLLINDRFEVFHAPRLNYISERIIYIIGFHAVQKEKKTVKMIQAFLFLFQRCSTILK